MLHHVSVGVADVGRATQFYDAALGALGYKRVMEFMPYAVGYGSTEPVFWVQLPNDQKAANSGNGTHIGFNAQDKTSVYAFHAAALSAGGKDEGGPGPRPEYSPNYYGAFVRDLDGNKLEAVYFATPAAKASAKAKRKAKPAKKAAPKRKAAAGKSARAKSSSRRKPGRKGARRR